MIGQPLPGSPIRITGIELLRACGDGVQCTVRAYTRQYPILPVENPTDETHFSCPCPWVEGTSDDGACMGFGTTGGAIPEYRRYEVRRMSSRVHWGNPCTLGRKPWPDPWIGADAWRKSGRGRRRTVTTLRDTTARLRGGSLFTAHPVGCSVRKYGGLLGEVCPFHSNPHHGSSPTLL